eukprot:gnl/Chilomastix_cuspidata/1150.p1 GENE.gnl/Chilomastix_cuspidata/1150~~gnl/Chilomastix_cuspidata/1150.p1  ORF type:complete len:597 (-),score=261.81 gnl/Chilomastix_cuspidata/1150:87-1877(-)
MALFLQAMKSYDSSLFFEQLKSNDISDKLKAIRGLPLLAVAIGNEEVVDSIIPSLSRFTKDTDEVCLALAEMTSILARVIQKDAPDSVNTVFPILTALANNSALRVRSSVVDAFTEIAKFSTLSQVKDELVRLTLEFLSHRKNNELMEVGIQLVPLTFTHVGDEQRADFVDHFTRLVKEQNTLIKLKMTETLGRLLDLIDDEETVDSLEPVVERLALDPHSSVRVASLEVLLKFAPKRNTAKILSNYMLGASDNMWSVRFRCAELLPQFGRILLSTASDSGTFVVPMHHVAGVIANLTNDIEPEIQIQAYARVSEFLRVMAELDGFAATFKKILKSLFGKNPEKLPLPVQEHFSLFVTGSPSFLGREQVGRLTFPVAINLVKTGDTDLKIATLEKLGPVIACVAPELVQDHLCAIAGRLSSDPSWHVKKAFGKVVPDIARIIPDHVFNDQILPGLLRWFRDGVFAIRTYVGTIFERVAQHYGSEWLQRNVVHTSIQLMRHKEFKVRVSVTLAFVKFAPIMDAAYVIEKVLPAAAPLTKDLVPNVRIACAELLQAIARAVPEAWHTSLASIVMPLGEDSCAEVVTIARKIEETVSDE